MIKKHLILVLTLLVLFSIPLILFTQDIFFVQPKPEAIEPAKTIPSGTKQSEIIHSGIIHSVEKKHKFSSPDYEDLFRITLKGTDTYNGTAEFTITSNNKVIYKEEFPGYDLIGYGLIDTDEHKVTREEECNYIIERMNTYFDEENFWSPATKMDSTFEADYSDEKVWKDISSDPTAVVFSYLVGEERNREIAYSKKSAKVVVFREYD